MNRPIFFKLLAATLLLLAGAIFILPGKKPEPPRYLPWQIKTYADGSSEVLGIHLGQTRLGEAEQFLQEEAKISLFINEDGSKSVEAFFEHISLNGLSAKLVAGLPLSEQELEQVYNRGERVKTLAVGRRQVSLADADKRWLRQKPIISLSYLPRIDLSPELVRARFGEPEQIIKENEVAHWLYPSLGLDIVLHPEQKDLLQYVPPQNFDQLIKPLKNAQLTR